MPNTITIRTNNIPRDIVHGFELTEKQRAEFDYMDDVDNGQFFVYKGQIYDLGEFMRIDANREPCISPLSGWDGYSSDSFFSGVVVKYVDNFERVIVGQYFS